VQGDATAFGPDVRVYAYIDYIAWLMSCESNWLPERIKQFLIKGMREWAVWASKWGDGLEEYGLGGRGIITMPTSLLEAKHIEAFKLTKNARMELEDRFDASAELLGLPESGGELVRRFLEHGFIEAWQNPMSQ